MDLGPPKQRAVLTLLASRVGRPVAVDALLEALWAGAPPPAALASLRAYVANLRRVLEPDRAPRAPATVLRTYTAGYLLDSHHVDVDVHRRAVRDTERAEAQQPVRPGICAACGPRHYVARPAGGGSSPAPPTA